MTVLTRLFRQATPNAKTLDDQVADLSTQSADFVAGIALGDGEPSLRIAAIEKLGAGEVLFKVAEDAAGAGAVQSAAQKRVAQLIDSNTLDYAEYCRRTTNAATMLSVAAYCNDATRLQQAIASIADPEVLSRLAIEAASSKVRQLAAEAINDPAQLRQVLKDARGGKDKNVYKIIKHKCDVLHAAEKAAAEIQASIVALCAALERHIHHPHDNLFMPTLEHLNTQWNTLAGQAPADIKLRAEHAIDRCRDIVTQHVQAMASQAARAGAIANADINRQSILTDLRSLLAVVYSNESTDAGLQIAQCTERWKEIAGYKAANAGDQASFAQLSNAITELSALIAQHGSLQAQADRFRDASDDADLHAQVLAVKSTLKFSGLLGDAIPPAALEASAAAQAWEQSRQDKQAAEANALRQLSGLIRKASGVLADGKTGAAAGLRRAIEERLRALPSVPANLSAQLHTLDEKLSLLQDWRSYAVAPKRIELIEQMEGLIGNMESPQILADNIKRLQDEWKLISKGNTEDTDAEWQRFHQAAQTAYQPCREYFTAQAKQREGNLNKRKALLERLTNFVASQNWEQTDWREVARALRESKQQWRNHQPVERAANKPLQESFEALTKDLEARLEAESGKNADEKKALIAHAQRLLDSPDGRQAIDEVKRLQLAWKNVGIVARDDDQKLWAEFREHCDALFAKRQQQHSEQTAALQESKTRAVALCEEAEQLLSLSGVELLEGVKKLSALRELFDAIGELPKANARDLQMRFDRALDRCEKSVAQQRAYEKSQAWNNLLDAADKIRLYRLAEDADERAALKQAAQAFIDGIQHWPKSGLQAIKNELAKEGAMDLAASEAALRTLCIRAEILTDQSTPPADQQFRREYQLKRLTQGIAQSLGQARGSTKDELDAMVFEWLAVGATRSDVYAGLLERFKRCRAKH